MRRRGACLPWEKRKIIFWGIKIYKKYIDFFTNYRLKYSLYPRTIYIGQWRRYVEAQRRVPPLGKKENKKKIEKEIQKIFVFAKKIPLNILVF